jgi:centromere/kinetochore protein ZW10
VDIEWYFAEGALIDYDAQELAHLVRALFAETPLRAQAIAKLLEGHPARM